MGFLKWLEAARTPFFDTAFGFVTRFGEETVAILLLCAVYWCVSKLAAYRVGVAYFLSGLAVQGLKIGFRVDRPWVADPSFSPVPSAVEHATGYSFPSGHTQSAAAMFGTLGAFVRNKAAKAVFFTLVALVAFSRLYLGVHTPADVAVALLITILLVWFSTRIIKEPGSRRGDLLVALCITLFAAGVIAVAFILYKRGDIAYEYLSDCLKAAGAGVGFAAGFFIERAWIRFPVQTDKLWKQAVKLVLGVAGLLLIKEGVKAAVGTGPVIDTLRYFTMLIWVTVCFPLIIKRCFSKDTARSE
jgi:membrane-associated phospholipid phosphatase